MDRVGALAVSVALASALGTLGVSASPSFQSRKDTPVGAPELRDVPLCEVIRHHERYENARIRVTGFVSYGFEDFSLWDPTCAGKKATEIWVTYGGAANSGVIYCCPGEGIPRGAADPHPLVEDTVLRDFRALLVKEGDTTVRATLVGTLLIKKEEKHDGRITEIGYGHFGCCDLLVVERVERFDGHDRQDLDYVASSDISEEPVRSCKSRGGQFELKDDRGNWLIAPRFAGGDFWIRLHAAADRGERRWSLTDPARAALVQIQRLYGNAVKTEALTRSIETPTRQVFDWVRADKWTRVVVARPYWLSFFAKHRSSCLGANCNVHRSVHRRAWHLRHNVRVTPGSRLAAIVLASVVSWPAGARPQVPAPAAPAGYTLSWSDEFEKDGAPDPARWGYERGFVRNEELQWYQPENARVERGLLVIEGRREPYANPNYQAGATDWKRARESASYTSASVTTRNLHSWQYGRFEMRGRIDTRAGLWPAFWTLGTAGGWPRNGEIDIMEYYRGLLLANVAWGSPAPGRAVWADTKTPIASLGDRWSDAFHVWRMDWDADRIQLFVDDRRLNDVDLARAINEDGTGVNPFHQPHYIILNLAIGGTSGGDPAPTAFPARFEVDYVRVYQKAFGPEK